MPNKRPTTAQVRARQVNLLEYIASTGKSYREAAAELDVTPKQLHRFLVERSSRQVRSQYNRSPVYAKLYRASEHKGLQRAARTQGVKLRRLDYRYSKLEQIRSTPGPITPEEQQALNDRLIYGHLKESIVFSGQKQGRTLWADYVLERNLPVSTGKNFSAYNRMLYDGRITQDEYDDAYEAWREFYGIE